MLSVSGFSGHLAALNGAYSHVAENHTKPVYRKRAELEGAQTCCVYFWDERDGEALAGWWMAPEVGGEQVWAHSASRSPTPPTSGWKVPWHATTVDPAVTMQVTTAAAGVPAGGGVQQFGAQQANPQQAYPAAAQQQAAYTQQAAYQQQQAAYAAQQRTATPTPPATGGYPQQQYGYSQGAYGAQPNAATGAPGGYPAAASGYGLQQPNAAPGYPQAAGGYPQPGAQAGYGQQPVAAPLVSPTQGAYGQQQAPQGRFPQPTCAPGALGAYGGQHPGQKGGYGQQAGGSGQQAGGYGQQSKGKDGGYGQQNAGYGQQAKGGHGQDFGKGGFNDGKGFNAKGGKDKGKGGKGGKGKGDGKRPYDQKGGYNQKGGFQQGGYDNGWNQQNKFPRTDNNQWAGQQAHQGMQQNAQTAQAKQLEDRKMKAMTSLTSSCQMAERATETMRTAEGDASSKQPMLTSAKTAVATLSRMIDMHLKGATLQEPEVVPFRAVITRCQSSIESLETMAKMEHQKKLTDLKAAVMTDAEPHLAELVKLLEKAKDASAVFTSELKDQLTTEQTITAKEKTETEMNPAILLVNRLRTQYCDKFKEVNKLPQTETAEIREALVTLKERIDEREQEIKNIQNAMRKSVMIANQALAAKKREEEIAKEKVERERVVDWNSKLCAFTFQMNNVIESVRKVMSEESLSDEDLKEKTALLMGYKQHLADCMEEGKNDVMQQSRNAIKVTSNNIDKMCCHMKGRLLEKQRQRDNEIRIASIQAAIAARARQGEKDNDQFFKQQFGTKDSVDQRSYISFVRKLPLSLPTSVSISDMFNAVTHMIGPDATTLSKDDFFLHVVGCYYRVSKQTTFAPETTEAKTEETTEAKTETEVPGEPLEVDSFVQLLEVPRDIGPRSLGAKCKLAKDNRVGLVTLTANQNHFLVPYYPHYVVVQDTVLTDTFDMKKFNVVARVKSGDKFRATSVPMSLTRESEEDTMTRVKGVKAARTTAEGEDKDTEASGFVTLMGNKGSQMFKHVPTPALPQGDAIVATKFDTDKFDAVLDALASRTRDEIKKQISELEEGAEKVLALHVALKEMTSADDEPAQEETDALLSSSEKTLSLVCGLGNSLRQQLQRLARDCQYVEKGPYATLYKELDALLEEVNKHYGPVEAIKTELYSYQHYIRFEANKRRVAREEQERVQLAAKLGVEMTERSGALREVVQNFQALQEKRELIPRAVDMKKRLDEMKDLLEQAETFIEEYRKWLEENTLQRPVLGALQKTKQTMGVMFNTLRNNTGMVSRGKLFVQDVYEMALLDRAKIELALGLADYGRKHKVKKVDMFAKIAGKKDVLSQKDFEVFLTKKAKMDAVVLEAIMTSVGAKDGFTKDTFPSILTFYYRVQKPCLLTDILEAKECKKIRKLKVEEILELEEDHLEDDECGIVRFKVTALADKAQGYVALAGNKGTQYLSVLRRGYKVVKHTIISEQLSLDTTPKIVRKLKVGEILRMVEPPVLDEKSTLWRIKAMALGDNIEGYVTVLGNQGTCFLANCDIPADIPVIADLPTADEEMKDVAVKKEEVKEEDAKEEVKEEVKEEDAAPADATDKTKATDGDVVMKEEIKKE